MLRLHDKFRKVRKLGNTLPATAFYNIETLRTIPETAKRPAAVRHLTDALLVLHGSPGVADKAICKTVKPVICKVNMAAKIKNRVNTILKNELANNKEIDLRKIFPPAINAVKGLIEHKLSLVN